MTDYLTGKTWLQNANCFDQMTFANALAAVNALASGSCGLTDGSVAGDWAVPNRFELESILDLGNADGPNGAVPDNNHFTNLQAVFDSDAYWSSSTVPSLSSVYAIAYR